MDNDNLNSAFRSVRTIIIGFICVTICGLLSRESLGEAVCTALVIIIGSLIWDLAFKKDHTAK